MLCRFHFPVSLCVLTVLVGCGEDVPEEVVPELVPVTGVVTLDGEPAEGVSVMFSPTGSTTGNGAFAMTDASGRYTLKYHSGAEGVPVGEYNVLFSKFVQQDGSPIPPGAMAADVQATNALPARYQQGGGMDTRAQVPQAGGTFDFKLTTK